MLSRSSSAPCRRSHTPAACQSPGRHARAAELAGDEAPGDARDEDEDDGVEGDTVGNARPTRPLGLDGRQERLDHLPDLVSDLEDARHRATSRRGVMSTSLEFRRAARQSSYRF